MGLFSAPAAPAVPPPPPLPPAAPPPTIASGSVQQAGASSKAKSAIAAGAGFNGTDLTGGQGVGAGPAAKAVAIGSTS
jgi:hypothetical protein